MYFRFTAVSPPIFLSLMSNIVYHTYHRLSCVSQSQSHFLLSVFRTKYRSETRSILIERPTEVNIVSWITFTFVKEKRRSPKSSAPKTGQLGLPAENMFNLFKKEGNEAQPRQEERLDDRTRSCISPHRFHQL